MGSLRMAGAVCPAGVHHRRVRPSYPRGEVRQDVGAGDSLGLSIDGTATWIRVSWSNRCVQSAAATWTHPMTSRTRPPRFRGIATLFGLVPGARGRFTESLKVAWGGATLTITFGGARR